MAPPLLPITRLIACPACAEHIKSNESICPHCGGQVRGADGRVLRGASAVLMGLALSGCPNKEPEPTTTGDSGTSSSGGDTDTDTDTDSGTTMIAEPEYGVPVTTSVSGEPDYGVPATDSVSDSVSGTATGTGTGTDTDTDTDTGTGTGGTGPEPLYGAGAAQ